MDPDGLARDGHDASRCSIRHHDLRLFSHAFLVRLVEVAKTTLQLVLRVGFRNFQVTSQRPLT